MWQLSGRIAQAEDVQQDEDDGDNHEEIGDEIVADPEPPTQAGSAQHQYDRGPDNGGVARGVVGGWRRRIGADRFRSHDFARLTGTRKFGGAHKEWEEDVGEAVASVALRRDIPRLGPQRASLVREMECQPGHRGILVEELEGVAVLQAASGSFDSRSLASSVALAQVF